MKIILHGKLGRLCGKEHEINTSVPAEAIEGLSRQLPNWPVDMLIDAVGFGTEEALRSPTDEKELHLMPSLSGGGGIGRIIIGVAIMAAVVFSGGTWTPLAIMFFSMGMTIAMSGVMMLFMKAPTTHKDNDPPASKYIGNGRNTSAIGTYRILAWGRNRIAGHWLSLQVDAKGLINAHFPFTLPPDVRRYYKLEMTQTQGGSVQALQHLQLFDTIGGSDFLQAAVAAGTATVTASSTFSGFPVSNLTDGDPITSWAGESATETIFIDLGANSANWKDVNEISVAGRAGILTQGPRDLTWHHSDNGSSYTQRFAANDISIRARGGPNYGIGTRLRTVSRYPTPPAGYHRRWGIKMKTTDGGLYHVKKIEMRNSIGGATRCTGGYGQADVQWDDSYDPLNVFEGSFGSPWVAYASDPATAWYEHLDGNEQPKPAEIMLQATTSFPSRMPRTFDLVYQDYNGGPVTVQESFSTGAWSTADEIRTFTVA